MAMAGIDQHVRWLDTEFPLDSRADLFQVVVADISDLANRDGVDRNNRDFRRFVSQDERLDVQGVVNRACLNIGDVDFGDPRAESRERGTGNQRQAKSNQQREHLIGVLAAWCGFLHWRISG